MNFLEAHRLVSEFRGGPERPILFALSGTGEPFRVYLEAAGAKRGLAVHPRFLAFNTLGQHLASGTSAPAEAEVLLLFPWDFVPELDWRSGVPPERVNMAEVLGRAEQLAERLLRRPGARLLYVSAEVPPVVGYAAGDRMLARALDQMAARLGATPVPAEACSLGAYFASGCPVGGAWLGRVAELAVALATTDVSATHKALITDLDDTLWAGVIAEDGVANIAFGPEGRGYRHYVYQTFLARLRQEGVILAVVTRNDAEVVLPPLRSGRMPLGESDLVTVCASYHAKSAQIRQLAGQLNLGLDAFVFVDDNPVELEEVRQALPQVEVVDFPHRDDDLPQLLEKLAQLFGRRELTREDRERTDLYRRRLEGLPPADVAGADLTGFLAGLQMRLVVHDRSRGDRTRAVQLINKTNQFNANGRRWTDAEVATVLGRGGKLLGASLSDRSGSHGEILACLMDADGTIEAFVMSCRVFQRRVEAAFLASLIGSGVTPRCIRFAPTERNEPFRQFVLDAAFGQPNNGVVPLDAAAFHTRHRDALDLFTVTWD
jgi:FkbH-like protein